MLILKPSKIHGIGVFTTKRITKGTVFDFTSDAVLVKKVRNVYHKRYCVRYQEGWWCPQDFNQMNIGWYLNHSTKPNIEVETKVSPYHAVKDITAGQELTINYTHLTDKYWLVN